MIVCKLAHIAEPEVPGPTGLAGGNILEYPWLSLQICVCVRADVTTYCSEFRTVEYQIVNTQLLPILKSLQLFWQFPYKAFVGLANNEVSFLLAIAKNNCIFWTRELVKLSPYPEVQRGNFFIACLPVCIEVSKISACCHRLHF